MKKLLFAICFSLSVCIFASAQEPQTDKTSVESNIVEERGSTKVQQRKKKPDPMISTNWVLVSGPKNKKTDSFLFRGNGTIRAVKKPNAGWRRISRDTILVIFDVRDPESPGVLFHSKNAKVMRGYQSITGTLKTLRLK